VRIYIAASLQDARLALEVARTLPMRGHTATSSWYADLKPGVTDGDLTAAQCLELSQKIRREIRGADALLLLYRRECHGAMWEAGWAFGLGKTVYVVGDRKTASPTLRNEGALFFDSVDAVITAMTVRMLG